MEKNRSARIADITIMCVNTFSILVLLLWIFKEYQGTGYIYSISLSGPVDGGVRYVGVDVFPIIVLTCVVLITQLFLNFRLFQRNAPLAEVEKGPQKNE